MWVGQREEVDRVADGIMQHHLHYLHRRHVLIGREDHSCYTCSMCSSLGGSTLGCKAGAAVTAGTDDVVTGREQIDAAAEVGAPRSLWHELVHWVYCPYCDDLRLWSRWVEAGVISVVPCSGDDHSSFSHHVPTGCVQRPAETTRERQQHNHSIHGAGQKSGLDIL